MVAKRQERDFVEEACKIVNALSKHIEEHPECKDHVRQILREGQHNGS